MSVMPLIVLATWLAFTSVEIPSPSTTLALPSEPDENTRIDEIYDQESLMLLSLYSLKGNGKADYITGRTVEQHVRSTYGNPVYYTLEFPIFYWWNHTMWNDPFVDGVNGNEQVYQEETDFDVSRYKPCAFNGQLC
ncbi:hypothetical protein [uncultured Nitrospira sp.]|uniref:hypothetical protein n=1 Tax=uncultured Nitrospira sp. TaxID=157176 RepID=UPI0031404FBF